MSTQNIPESVLFEACLQFNLDPSTVHHLGGGDGAVFVAKQAEVPRVLKITPSTPDNVAVARARLHFVAHLHAHGVPLAAPLPTTTTSETLAVMGNPTEPFIAILMPQIRGDHADHRNPTQWNANLFTRWGALVGQMHALAQSYTPRDALPDWRMEQIAFVRASNEAAIRAEWAALAEQLLALPKDPTGYGAIHNDLHPWNFLVADSGQLTVIDFEVCLQHWFIMDIAIALYYALYLQAETTTPEAATRAFLQPFMVGYRQFHTLSANWFTHLPTFLHYRRVLLYTVFAPNLPEERRAAWRAQVLARQPLVTFTPAEWQALAG